MSVATLDASKPQSVEYCIPLWLRDEQIKVNTANVKGRIAPQYDLRSDSLAIVCYGPSLNDTWEQVKNFQFIMTCSGAHHFLIDRGIIPTYHVEVDPREHKCLLLGDPHPNVEYLIASTCHPKFFAKLQGFNVKLWHVFDPNDEGIRQLPEGEWAITGGCGAGLRAMTLGRFLGFRDLHIFGMDGSEGKTGKHAGAHPNQPKLHNLTTYNNVEYRTTPAMLEAARQTWHELDVMPDVNATFYGEGLVQAMAKDYVRVPQNDKYHIAYNKPELISSEYRALNAQLHQDNLAYGVGGGKHAETILKLSESLKTQSILDYGCGKGYLAKALPFPIWEYDPAIPLKSESPRPADIVVCTDVLEHIEPDKLIFVLDDLRRCTKQVGYFTIHTGPAAKILADGRNAHLLQKNAKWWQKKLSQFFTVGKIFQVGPVLHVIVGVHPKYKKYARKNS